MAVAAAAGAAGGGGAAFACGLLGIVDDRAALAFCTGPGLKLTPATRRNFGIS